MAQEAKKHLKLQLPAYQEMWDKMKQPQGPNVQASYDGLLIDMDKL